MGNRWSDQENKLHINYKFIEHDSENSFNWVPSIGKNIDFFIGEIENPYNDKGITKYLQKSKIYEVPLNLPDASRVCNNENMAIDSRKIVESTVKYLLSETDFLTELARLCSGGSNLIGANCGCFWEDEPVRCLRNALNENGYRFEEPPVYSKIGGRNRYQTHGIRILEMTMPKTGFYSVRNSMPYFWSVVQFPKH